LFTQWEVTHHVVRGTIESLGSAGIFSTYPHALLNNYQALTVELVITAVLMMSILALTDDQNGAPKGFAAALLIGILIAVIGASLGPLTGFAMNPARDFGPKFFAFLAGWGDVALTGGRDNPYFWVPIVGPILGAQLGAAIYIKLLAPYLPANRALKTQHTDKVKNAAQI
jgi:glycerol uptake facilitator protein